MVRAEDRQEARAISRFWDQYVYDKDTPVQVSMTGAACFAIAHALLAVAKSIDGLATAVKERN